MTRRATFREADVTRAAKGAANAGLCVAEIIIDPDGTMRIKTGQPGAVQSQSAIDQWIAGKADARRGKA